MRISTQVFYQRNTASVMSQQSKLSQQNIHLSTQKRVINGADDPVAISTIQRLKQQLSVDEQYIKNGDVAETANAIEDTSLGQVTNILQRVRELTVSAGNGTYNASSREAVAKELEGLREELVGVANTRDGNSQYIFSGYEVDTQPFQSNEFGTIEYHGDEGSQSYSVGSGVSVQGNDSGSSIFMEISNGNGTYLAEANSSNSGGGVIDAGSVIDKNVASLFPREDYNVVINQSSTGAAQYSVYGINDSAVTGNASIKISQVDLGNSSIGTVTPADIYPNINSDVDITLVTSGTGFGISINGVLADSPVIPATNPATFTSVYDPALGMQTFSANGLSIDIEGLPVDTDSYKMTKFVAPTDYMEGQAIELNGIKTSLKGSVLNGDTFTLTQSENKDIFATIQGAIDALRIPGEQDTFSAQREIQLNMSLLQIDSAMNNISEIRTGVGARMRTIENQRESTQDFTLTNQKTLSNIEDLDMAAAISDFKMQLSLLEVSQQTFVQMQSLSLFKLI